jgi:hypothetical protein
VEFVRQLPSSAQIPPLTLFATIRRSMARAPRCGQAASGTRLARLTSPRSL